MTWKQPSNASKGEGFALGNAGVKGGLRGKLSGYVVVKHIGSSVAPAWGT